MARMVDIVTAADHLGIPVNAIRKATRAGQLPHLKLNGRYRYDLRLLDAFIQDRMMQSIEIGGETSDDCGSGVQAKKR